MPSDRIEPPFDSRPIHIVDRAGDLKTHCGISIKTPAALPYVGRMFVRAHVEGRPPLTFCGECLEADSEPMSWLREVEPDRWSISDRD